MFYSRLCIFVEADFDEDDILDLEFGSATIQSKTIYSYLTIIDMEDSDSNDMCDLWCLFFYDFAVMQIFLPGFKRSVFFQDTWCCLTFFLIGVLHYGFYIFGDSFFPANDGQ